MKGRSGGPALLCGVLALLTPFDEQSHAEHERERTESDADVGTQSGDRSAGVGHRADHQGRPEKSAAVRRGLGGIRFVHHLSKLSPTTRRADTTNTRSSSTAGGT